MKPNSPGSKSKQAIWAKNGTFHDKSVEESLELQKCMRQLTHRLLAAQENERAKLSHELQDEIAQMLLGINVRLVTLKQENRSNASGLKKEIASAQCLIAKSARAVRQLAHKLDVHKEAHGDPFLAML
jgi:signal transduction histidine kinase